MIEAASSFNPRGRPSEVTPFTLQASHEDGMRSAHYYYANDHKHGGQDFSIAQDMRFGGDAGGTSTRGSTKQGRGTTRRSSAELTSRTGKSSVELRTRLHRLRQLTEELNRALDDFGTNSPRVVQLRGRIAELVRMNEGMGTNN